MSELANPLGVAMPVETLHRVASIDGVTAVAYDWGGDGPPLLIAHATGLHAHCYLALARRLRSSFRVYGVDVRAQGAATSPADGSFAWPRVGEDLVHVLDALGLSGTGELYGIGHSLGGALVMMAEAARPGTFRAILGYEPVVFDAAAEGPSADSPMPGAARRRRATFASKTAAYENYLGKPPFDTIDDDVLRAYVHWGFADSGDGSVTLRCTPEHEARLFEGAYHHDLSLCERVGCPTTVILSAHTTRVFRDAVPLQALRLPQGRLVAAPDRTHFGLFERTPEIADVVRDLLIEDGAR